MCRFVLYMGSEITIDLLTTRPSNSIIHQSFRSRLTKEPLNGDGFGLAWYVPDVSLEPAQFRSVQPAWNNVNLRHLARVSRSSVVLAHVRAASPGTGVSEANCHPFVNGRLAFMHNGSVAGFQRLRREISSRLSDESYSWIRGTTDSECLFALFCDHLSLGENADNTEALAHAIQATITEVVELTGAAGFKAGSYLNLAVTDGESGVVSRYASGRGESLSLYASTGTHCVCEAGVCRMIRDGKTQSTVVVASEPLNDESEWAPVPHNEILLIYPDRSLKFRGIS